MKEEGDEFYIYRVYGVGTKEARIKNSKPGKTLVGGSHQCLFHWY
jgi:hypothetical protein